MSTPTNEQRLELFREAIAANVAWAIREQASWALSRIEELAKRLDAVREGNVWHGANGGFFSARTGDAYNTLDEALDAELSAASSGKIPDLMEALKASLAPLKSAVENPSASSSGANTP